jgi:hypothetical protein
MRLQPFHGEREVFSSNHKDTIHKNTIMGRCRVHSLKQYEVSVPSQEQHRSKLGGGVGWGVQAGTTGQGNRDVQGASWHVTVNTSKGRIGIYTMNATWIYILLCCEMPLPVVVLLPHHTGCPS